MSDLVEREMTAMDRVALRLRMMWTSFSRRFPRLVWYGQEVEVNIQFVSDRLPHTDSPNEALTYLWDGPLNDARNSLLRAGVEFDQGMGFGGRDWQWDWSLRGPVRVEFLRVAKRDAAIKRAQKDIPDAPP